MGKREKKEAEISLFPFLSIIVCLIGTLVLIIVVLTMMQSQLGDGRTQEEIERAKKAQEIQKRIEEQVKQIAQIKDQDPEAAKNADELEKQKQFLVNLRKKMADNASKPASAETNAEMQKELENLMIQVETLKKEEPVLKKEVADLTAEVEKLNKMKDTPPPVIVRTGGTGSLGDNIPFFVEANASGLILHEPDKKTIVPLNTLHLDENYNSFLKKASQTRKSMVLFLVRNDGFTSWARGAGWAEGQFNLRTSKLPLPGKGEADLSQFKL